nr:MAG TPA: hypothetical protein [Microviridae sp.]
MQDTVSRLYMAILRLYRFDRAIAVFASTVSRLVVLRAVPPPLALALLPLAVAPEGEAAPLPLYARYGFKPAALRSLTALW